MALYSFNHKVISKTQSSWEGKAYARVKYICRKSAASDILKSKTEKHSSLSAFCKDAEDSLSKNGRIAECFIVALPIEATQQQMVELTKAFSEHASKSQVPYVAAIHNLEKDQDNPHFHLLCFDKKAERKKGQKGRSSNIIGLSRKGKLEELRADWEAIHNEHMKSWGFSATSMIDNRSLRSQGHDRLPTLHEGPAGRAMWTKGVKRPSKLIETVSGRNVDWPLIDEGFTRQKTNQLIIGLNKENKEKKYVKQEKKTKWLYRPQRLRRVLASFVLVSAHNLYSKVKSCGFSRLKPKEVTRARTNQRTLTSQQER